VAGLFEQYSGPLEPSTSDTSDGRMPKGGINWSQPFMYVPIPYPGGVYWFGVPTYQLHGGKNYTDGQFNYKGRSRRRGIDATDDQFRTHDDDILDAKGDPLKIYESDRKLYDNLNAVETLNKEGLLQNPNGEYYTYAPNSDEARYNWAARQFFGAKTDAQDVISGKYDPNNAFLSGRGENAASDAGLPGGLNDLPLPDQSEGFSNLMQSRAGFEIPPTLNTMHGFLPPKDLPAPETRSIRIGERHDLTQESRGGGTSQSSLNNVLPVGVSPAAERIWVRLKRGPRRRTDSDEEWYIRPQSP
jgi:hypothetical protein